MADKQTKVGWKFWALWVSASAMGWGTGLVAGLFAALISAMVVAFVGGSLRMDEFAGSGGFGTVEKAVIAGVVGAMTGAALGLGQWIILQRWTSRAGRWVLASTLGGAAGWVVVEVASLGMSPIDFDGSQFGLQVGAMAGAIIGALLGATQWIVLRRRVSRAGWWVLASTLGWALGWSVGWAVGGVGPFVLPGALGGAVTGAVLVWLLQGADEKA